MKNKGFTLMELLAVLIILAIIALIATPTILNIIEDTRIKAAIQSAYGYVDAVNLEISSNKFTPNEILDSTYDILDENYFGVKHNGTSPTQGILTILNSNVTSASLCIMGYPIYYNDGTAIYDKDSTICPVEYKFIEPEGTVIADLCNGGTYEVGSYKIKTVEDLVCFSKLVDEGNNFSGSTIMLLSDLDIKNKSTYKDANKISSYDINGNGINESIYVELTTEKGFNPIGDSSNVFTGTFEGYGFNIDNLYINRTSEDFIGLVANNSGTIQGLNLISVNISGGSRVGGLVGNNAGTINEINVNGVVTGTSNDTGGVVGLNYRNSSSEQSVVTNVLVNADVSGLTKVGGLVGEAGGYLVYSNVYGIMEGGSVNGTSNVGNLIGYVDNYVNRSGYVNSSVTAVGNGVSGTSYDQESLFIYEQILDTYIGGDNDSSGYYFDYNDEGEFVVKSIAKDPIKNTLDGSGTEDDPYIIKSTDDWKVATSTVKEGYYYKLASNLDFTNKTFYPMGTGSNYFTGYFDGSMYTIKNITTSGSKQVGVFGYSTGVIEGINFENINLTSTDSSVGLIGYNNVGLIQGINAVNININGVSQVGGIAGSNTGTINEVNINAVVTGTSTDIGGVAGVNYRNDSSEQAIVTNALVNVDVTGGTKVGGLVGNSGGYLVYSNVYGIMEGGSVKGTSNVGNLIGYVDNYVNRSGYVNSSVTVVGNGVSGTSYDQESLFIYDKVLDTYLGRDNDSSGYYFDYNEDGEFVVKSISRNPIKNTLQGSGTESNPYIIKTTDDWKVATSTAKEGYYYKLASDLDFANKAFYPMGSINSYFTGHLDGNMYTIKNVDIEGVDYTGIFGYNAGVIEGINFENITITGGDYVGIIAYNTNTVLGINATNIDVSGNKQVGGLVGYNSGLINEVNLTGKVSLLQTNYNVGGITGDNRKANSSEVAIVKNALVNVELSGNEAVGGIAGASESYSSSDQVSVSGILDGGSINGNKYTGKIIGYQWYSGINAYAASNVSMTGRGGNSGTSMDSTYVNNLEYYSNILDVTDSDSSGYYFGYNSDSSDIVVLKAS